jgi:hypothetical protein
MKIETIKRDKNELCAFCEHPWSHHHQGCNKCFAIPSTHGHYCEGALCSCLEFSEEGLADDDLESLMSDMDREEMARDRYYDQKLDEMMDEGRTIRGRHV